MSMANLRGRGWSMGRTAEGSVVADLRELQAHGGVG